MKKATAQIISKTDTDLLPKQGAATLAGIKQQVLTSGQGAREIVRTTIAGKSFLYDLTIEPMRDVDVTVVGITCATLDVTGQQNREEYL